MTQLRVQVPFKGTRDRLEFWNGSFGLSEKELDVLACLMDGKGYFCSTLNRREAAAVLGMTLQTLGTYIKRIKDKKAISYEKGSYRTNRLLSFTGTVVVSGKGEQHTGKILETGGEHVPSSDTGLSGGVDHI